MFGQDNDANGNRMFTPVSAAGSTYVTLGGSIPVNDATLPNVDLPTDPPMADLEDTGIFSSAYDYEVDGAVFSGIREFVDIVKTTLELGARGVEYGEE
nr:hypothetical protein [Tanacetum cinerariifolium]